MIIMFENEWCKILTTVCLSSIRSEEMNILVLKNSWNKLAFVKSLLCYSIFFSPVFQNWFIFGNLLSLNLHDRWLVWTCDVSILSLGFLQILPKHVNGGISWSGCCWTSDQDKLANAPGHSEEQQAHTRQCYKHKI